MTLENEPFTYRNHVIQDDFDKLCRLQKDFNRCEESRVTNAKIYERTLNDLKECQKMRDKLAELLAESILFPVNPIFRKKVIIAIDEAKNQTKLIL